MRPETKTDELAPLLTSVRELQQQVAHARLAIGTGDKHRAVAHLQNAQRQANVVESHLAKFAEV